MSPNLSHMEVLDFKTGMSAGSTKQFARTFGIHSNTGQLDDLMRNTNNGMAVNSNTLAASSSVISMSSDARSEIQLDGGWDAPRCVCFLKVRNNATGDIYLIAGYTSVDFISPNGGISERATVSFASFTEFGAYTLPSGEKGYKPCEFDSLLSQQYLSDSPFGKAVYEKPNDVLTGAALAELQETSHMGGEDGFSISAKQTWGCSTAENALAGKWLGDTLTAMTDARIGDSMTEGQSSGMTGSQMAINAASNALVTPREIRGRALLGSLLTGVGSTKEMEITWGELIHKLPGLRNHLQPATTSAGGGNIADFESWNNRDSAMVFSELASAIPAVMLRLGISSIRFRMTNEHTISDPVAGKRPRMAIDASSGFGADGKPAVSFVVAEMNHQEVLRAFEMRMCVDVFPRLCNGHNVTVSIDASLVSQMIMVVSYDGYETKYSCPTFAHARWSAITASASGHNQLTQGMARLADHLANSANGITTGNNSWGNTPTDVGGDWSQPNNAAPADNSGSGWSAAPTINF